MTIVCFFKPVSKEVQKDALQLLSDGVVSSFVFGVGKNTKWSQTAKIVFEQPKFEKVGSCFCMGLDEGTGKIRV